MAHVSSITVFTGFSVFSYGEIKGPVKRTERCRIGVYRNVPVEHVCLCLLPPGRRACSPSGHHGSPMYVHMHKQWYNYCSVATDFMAHNQCILLTNIEFSQHIYRSVMICMPSLWYSGDVTWSTD